jgi:ATP-dependent Lon protease
LPAACDDATTLQPEPAADRDDADERKRARLAAALLAFVAVAQLGGMLKHPGKLADALASHLGTSVAARQEVLETIPLAARVDLVLEQVNQARLRRGATDLTDRGA